MIHLSSIRPDNLAIFRWNDQKITQVTTGESFDQHPMPTPDGEGVVFASSENGSHHLFFLRHGERVKLTDHDLYEDHVRFDQQGNIYFCSDYEGCVAIYRAKWNGQSICMKDAEKLTEGPGNCFSFTISPDGKTLVFASNRDNLTSYMGPQPDDNYHSGRLYSMRIGDPSSCAPLTESPGNHWEGTPEFDSEGKFVFYYSSVDGMPRLYRYEFLTGSVVQVTEKCGAYPTVTRDGRILFCSKGKKQWKIKSMNANGQQVKTVVRLAGNCLAPRQHPDGSIYFFGEAKPRNSFEIEQGECRGIPLRVIRGFFPLVEDGKTSYIEEMQTVQACPQYTSGQYVFGLTRGADGNLLTTEGTPFASGESHIIGTCPHKNYTNSFTPARNAHPTAIKDGIVFSRQEKGERKQLYRLGKNGLARLTDEDADHVFPTSHRNLIAFSSTTDRKTYQLKLLDLCSRQVEVLTKGYVDIHAKFSPDGKFLVFTSNRGGMKIERPLCFFFNPQPYGDLYLMDIKTREIKQLTSSPYEDSTPDWS